MKLLILAILTTFSLSTSSPTEKQPQPKYDCKIMVVEKITFGIDEIMASSFNDTIKTMNIKIVNRCKKCNTDGPDYVPLIIRNENNDTIAATTINGIPLKYKDSRTYQVQAYKKRNWGKNPDISKLKISMPPYCDELMIKLR